MSVAKFIFGCFVHLDDFGKSRLMALMLRLQSARVPVHDASLKAHTQNSEPNMSNVSHPSQELAGLDSGA